MRGAKPRTTNGHATVEQLAALYGITPKSMRRFIRERRIRPVGTALSGGGRPAHLYRIREIRGMRDGRPMTRAARGLRRRPTPGAVLGLAMALAGL